MEDPEGPSPLYHKSPSVYSAFPRMRRALQGGARGGTGASPATRPRAQRPAHRAGLEAVADVSQARGDVDVLRAVARALAAADAVAHELGVGRRTALAVKYCERPVNQPCAKLAL